jgi:hypothetical protein
MAKQHIDLNQVFAAAHSHKLKLLSFGDLVESLWANRTDANADKVAIASIAVNERA